MREAGRPCPDLEGIECEEYPFDKQFEGKTRERWNYRNNRMKGIFLGGVIMDKKLVCPCGLTCCDCMFYKKEIYETAYKFKELIMNHELDRFLTLCSKRKSWEVLGEHLDISESQIWDGVGKHFDIFKQMPEFMNVLDGIIKLQCKATCQEKGGCSIGGNTHDCKALKCIKSKEYHGCWQCSDFDDCDKLKFLKNSYGYVIEDNLKIIKEKGIESVKSRGNKYYAWQRKKDGDVME